MKLLFLILLCAPLYAMHYPPAQNDSETLKHYGLGECGITQDIYHLKGLQVAKCTNHGEVFYLAEKQGRKISAEMAQEAYENILKLAKLKQQISALEEKLSHY